MTLFIDLQLACDKKNNLPDLTEIEKWVTCTLVGTGKDKIEENELTVRIVNSKESQALNLQYRHKDKATNVLSFPFQNPPGITLPLLGDLVICKDVVENEACEQHKTIAEHWAHMVIHGTLHLLGYDHIKESQAVEMESLETDLLIELGFTDPYLSEKSK